MSVWYDDRANLALLVEHMLAESANESEVVRAILKPWSYQDEFDTATALRNGEMVPIVNR